MHGACRRGPPWDGRGVGAPARAMGVGAVARGRSGVAVPRRPAAPRTRTIQ